MLPRIATSGGWTAVAILFLGLGGCAPIPMRYSILDELHIRYTAEDAAPSTFLLSDLSDSACAKPIKTVTLSSGDSVVVPGVMGRSNWMLLIPHDRLGGFHICVEQDGKKYHGVSKGRLGYRLMKFKVVCDLSSGRAPTGNWKRWYEMKAEPGICAVWDKGS